MIHRAPSARHTEQCNEATPGQVIIMVAIFATALIGVLGLATDLGISFAGRRSMQNAADAAAYAGARQIAKAAITTGISAKSEVDGQVTQNGFAFASANPTNTCKYVNDADTAVGNCSLTVPTTATGVKVTVTETHPTFFIHVLPGVGDTASTSATAIAHVMKPALAGTGPFIVCATNLRTSSGNPQKMNILNWVNGAWQINSAAVGKTFNIHSSQVEQCGNGNNSGNNFKGIADSTANISKSAPPATYFSWSGGVVASVAAAVEGINGCQAGTTINNCVAYLPVAVDDCNQPPIANPCHPTNPNGSNDKRMWTIGFAAFYIVESGNGHTGKLLDNYIVKGPATYGWTPGYYGPIAIKLTS